MRSPVIFIGMHRSGTSMLGRLLEELGLFCGTKKDENNEAVFFQRINEWLLAQSGGRWDMPLAINYLWEEEEALEWICDYVSRLMNGPRAIQFLGAGTYLKAGGIDRISFPWGWKDPRNTFTLPLWLRLFPEARVLYIERHGLDVAESLRVRARKNFKVITERYLKNRKYIAIRPKKGGFLESPRCSKLSGGISLWCEYVDQAEALLNQLPAERWHRVRYEDLLAEPERYLKESAEFCGLTPSADEIKRACLSIKGDRSFPHKKNEQLMKVLEKHSYDLSSRGY